MPGGTNAVITNKIGYEERLKMKTIFGFINNVFEKIKLYGIKKLYAPRFKALIDRVGVDKFESILEQPGYEKFIDGDKTIYKRNEVTITVEDIKR